MRRYRANQKLKHNSQETTPESSLRKEAGARIAEMKKERERKWNKRKAQQLEREKLTQNKMKYRERQRQCLWRIRIKMKDVDETPTLTSNDHKEEAASNNADLLANSTMPHEVIHIPSVPMTQDIQSSAEPCEASVEVRLPFRKQSQVCLTYYTQKKK